jgi:hypothetical protein
MNDKNLLLAPVVVAALTACGGGGGGGAPQNTSLGITATNIKQADFVALAPTDRPTQTASLLKRFLNVLLPKAYADQAVEEMVAVKDNVVVSAFSLAIPIKDFSIPSAARTGKQYIAVTGDFGDVTTGDGKKIGCNVIVASVEGGEASCVFKIASDESSTIPVAVFREGNVDGYFNSADAVYFVVNKQTGGYTLYRYYDGSTSIAKTSNTGKITKMIVGDRSFFGFDETGGSAASFIFGNVGRGFREGVTFDRIARFKGYVTFPTRATDYGNQSTYFMLDTAQSLVFSPEFSIDCFNPSSLANVASHSYGAFWISAADGKLCEVYELVSRPEPIAFRIVNDSANWLAIQVADDVLIGVASVGGANTLMIQQVAPNLQSLTSARSIDLTQRLAEVNLDEVVKLRRYAGGIAILGTKGGQSVTRYYNTKTRQLETFSTPPALLSDVVEVTM